MHGSLLDFDFSTLDAPPPEGLVTVDAGLLPTPASRTPLAVRQPSPEPLIPITGPKIIDVAAYAAAGWPQALPVSMARTSVVARLRAAALLLPERFGLAVYDAWRPLGSVRIISGSSSGRWWRGR